MQFNLIGFIIGIIIIIPIGIDIKIPIKFNKWYKYVAYTLENFCKLGTVYLLSISTYNYKLANDIISILLFIAFVIILVIYYLIIFKKLHIKFNKIKLIFILLPGFLVVITGLYSMDLVLIIIGLIFMLTKFIFRDINRD